MNGRALAECAAMSKLEEQDRGIVHVVEDNDTVRDFVVTALRPR